MKKGSWFVILMIIFLQAFIGQAQMTTDQEQRIQRLEQVIEQQQVRIQEMQNRLNTPQTKEYTEVVVDEYLKRPDIEEAGPEFGYEARGFFLRAPNMELYLSGFAQIGLAVFENDTFDNNSFYPNGVSFATDVYIYKDWHARVELNFMALPGGTLNIFQGGPNAETAQVWDAYVEYLGIKDELNNPTLALRVGQTHVPFTMQGQYNPNQGISIWSPAFIANWSHGRDPGLMFWGVLGDMAEYKLSIHNGEGRSSTNASDDVLMAGSLRLYPFKYSENPNTYFHVGAIRSRDNSMHTFGNVAAASLTTPWGRALFGQIDTDGDGIYDGNVEATQGWRTGVDVGFRLDMPLGDDKVNSIRVESEFMYITWERDFATGRLPWIQGYGWNFGMSFKHNMTPDVEGAGFFPLFVFSYSDVDNKKTDDFGYPSYGDFPGQRIFTYTFGFGYAFNKHVSAQVNWVMVDTAEKDIYNSAANAAKDDRIDGSDDIEHGWFLQFTAQW